MAHVTLNTNYQDTFPLEVQNHNLNFYGYGSGNGLMSEHNGRLDTTNFDGGITLAAWMIKPSSLHTVVSQERLISTAYCSNVIGTNDGDIATGIFQMGLCAKLPATPRFVEINYQIFAHAFNVWHQSVDGSVHYNMEIGLVQNEEVIAHTWRKVPLAVHVVEPVLGVYFTGYSAMASNEPICAQVISGNTVLTSIPNDVLDVGLAVKLELTHFDRSRTRIIRNGDRATIVEHDAFNRLTTGVGNIIAVARY